VPARYPRRFHGRRGAFQNRIIASLAGILFGFDTAAIAGVMTALS